MKAALFAGIGLGTALVIGSALVVRAEVGRAADRLRTGEKPHAVATSDAADAPYCTPEFNAVLERVLSASGIGRPEARRGCQPADLKKLVDVDAADFQTLFAPLEQRGAVVLFDRGSGQLDPAGQELVEQVFRDRRGGRYFLVVAGADRDRAISHKRANAVVSLLRDRFKDAEPEREIGTLWLGNEHTPTNPEYCSWKLSRDKKRCSAEAIKSSAFVAWVDCHL